MTIGSSSRVKNEVRDSIEQGFDAMHRVADTVTFPFAAVDGEGYGYPPAAPPPPGGPGPHQPPLQFQPSNPPISNGYHHGQKYVLVIQGPDPPKYISSLP
ncbi:hypothetical protein PTKIN_Ptkin09bG0010200 [Pterospermum kingtungense]